MAAINQSINMQHLDEIYALTVFFLGYGSGTVRDLRGDPNLAAVAPTTWVFAAMVAGWAAVAMFIYGFFVVTWWLPIAAVIVTGAVLFMEPRSVRFTRWRPLYGLAICAIGFLNVVMFFMERYR